MTTTQQTTLLERVILEPNVPAKASVIWLHGLGASGHDFEGVTGYLGLPSGHGTRFIFPHAKERPVTMNGGMRMRAWYDLANLNLHQVDDRSGLLQSADCIRDLIAHEVGLGIPSRCIVLMGFSQGGALSLYTGLRCRFPLAGIASLSGYLPVSNTLAQEQAPENLPTPILIAHGQLDPIVPLAAGQHAFDALSQSGYQPVLKQYPMAHMVCMEELSDLGNWLRIVLSL